MTTSNTLPCPLCTTPATDYHRDSRRAYLQCPRCQLVFVPSEWQLTIAAEKAVYDLHTNDPADAGYRRFLSRMLEPITARLPAGCCGLDFGCGPGPTLSVMFEERGYPTAVYDPLYANDGALLRKQYDFVTATEVAEHLRTPRTTLDQMWSCVRPGGYLGIMSKRVIDHAAFVNWHYITDETHICFFSEATFAWLADNWHTEAEFEGSDVVVFQK